MLQSSWNRILGKSDKDFSLSLSLTGVPTQQPYCAETVRHQRQSMLLFSCKELRPSSSRYSKLISTPSLRITLFDWTVSGWENSLPKFTACLTRGEILFRGNLEKLQEDKNSFKAEEHQFLNNINTRMKRRKKAWRWRRQTAYRQTCKYFLHAFKEELGDEKKDADEEKEPLEMLASKQL